MTIRRQVTALLAALFVTAAAGAATADDTTDAQAFVQRQHAQIETALKANASTTQIYSMLDKFVDYDELARRSFGEPCPVSGCTDLWAGLTPDQRTEVSGLLKQLVQKNYKKSLQKTLDYEVNYKDARKLDNAVKVRTEAKNKSKPRDPAVQVDYLVMGSGNGQKVVDMVTEGSSLTKNYYDQFKRMMSTPGQGYPYIVQKLNEKIAKKD